MAAQILFWLLRAPDGHAKNFSIQLLPRGRFQLTRLYDVMSAYPVLGDGANQWSPFEIKLAMALIGKNRHYEMHGIQRRHFNSTAQKLVMARRRSRSLKTCWPVRPRSLPPCRPICRRTSRRVLRTPSWVGLRRPQSRSAQ